MSAAEHWHDSSGIRGGCGDCQHELKLDLAKKLAGALVRREVVYGGNVAFRPDYEGLARVIDDILDLWPR